MNVITALQVPWRLASWVTSRVKSNPAGAPPFVVVVSADRRGAACMYGFTTSFLRRKGVGSEVGGIGRVPESEARGVRK